MQLQDCESIKAEEREVKRENIHHSHPKNQQQNSRGQLQNEMMMMMEINSDPSADKQSVYKHQRNQVPQFSPKIIDLSKEILPGIVKHCRSEKFISDDLAHCFFTNFTTKVQKDYIQCFRNGRLSLFDFSKCKINIIDHRRLTQMLVNHDGNKYLPPKKDAPFDYLKEGKEFLMQIYAMPVEQYSRITTEQVNKYYQTWWGGPENLNPRSPQQKLQTLDVEEAAKQGQEMQVRQKKRRMQEEQARLMRVTEQRATKDDLKDIAMRISTQLFGKLTQVKYQDQRMQEVGEEEKRGREGKKQKKSKKKSKKKKDRIDAQTKKQWIQQTKAKKQAGVQESATINKLD